MTDSEPNPFARPAKRKFTIGEKVFYLIFLCLVILPRLYAPDIVRYTADEGIHSFGAAGIVSATSSENLQIVGAPSVGIRNSALFMYLLSIPFFLWWNPLAGVIFISTLNIIQVIWSYHLARRWFGTWAAICVGMLYASGPWHIMYARDMWPPSCVGIFFLLIVQLSMSWLESGKSSTFFWLTVMTIVTPQVHFSGFCAPVFSLVILGVGWRRFGSPALVAAILFGFVIGIATWSPWLYFQHYENHWEDVKAALANPRSSFGYWEIFARAVEYLQVLLHSAKFDYWFEIFDWQLPKFFSPPLLYACYTIQYLLAGLFVISLLSALREKGSPRTKLIVFWAIMPVFMLMVIRPLVHPHYLLVAYPAPFLLIGRCIGHFCTAGKSWRKALVFTSLALIAGCHLAYLAGWYKYVMDDNLKGNGQIGLPYRDRLNVALWIVNDAGANDSYSVAGTFNGQNPHYYFLTYFERLKRRIHVDEQNPRFIYWIDENEGDDIGGAATDILRDSRKFFPFKVIKLQRVGPNRVFLLERI